MFNKERLLEYLHLLETTDIINCYQEFIHLFRFLRVQLEKELTQAHFQGNIVENAMEYAYFQMATDKMKERGLKIVVVFLPRFVRFEVWLSGANRQYQKKYAALLTPQVSTLEVSKNPLKTDYIARLPLTTDIDWGDEQAIVAMIKAASESLIKIAEELDV